MVIISSTHLFIIITTIIVFMLRPGIRIPSDSHMSYNFDESMERNRAELRLVFIITLIGNIFYPLILTLVNFNLFITIIYSIFQLLINIYFIFIRCLYNYYIKDYYLYHIRECEAAENEWKLRGMPLMQHSGRFIKWAKERGIHYPTSVIDGEEVLLEIPKMNPRKTTLQRHIWLQFCYDNYSIMESLDNNELPHHSIYWEPATCELEEKKHNLEKEEALEESLKLDKYYPLIYRRNELKALQAELALDTGRPKDIIEFHIAQLKKHYLDALEEKEAARQEFKNTLASWAIDQPNVLVSFMQLKEEFIDKVLALKSEEKALNKACVALRRTNDDELQLEKLRLKWEEMKSTLRVAENHFMRMNRLIVAFNDMLCGKHFEDIDKKWDELEHLTRVIEHEYFPKLDKLTTELGEMKVNNEY